MRNIFVKWDIIGNVFGDVEVLDDSAVDLGVQVFMMWIMLADLISIIALMDYYMAL